MDALDISTFPQYGIFCDESSQTKHRYIVIGCIFCTASSVQPIRQSIENAIRPHGGTSELKWGNVKKKNYKMYEALVNLQFDLIDKNVLHFSSLVIDTQKVDHKKYNEGNKEIGFNKFLFTLLYKFARVYKSQPRFYVLLDERTTVHTPEQMRKMLNLRVRRDMRLGYDPYRVVKFATSESDRLIQATDVLTGAVASRTNGHHLMTGAAWPKKALTELIAKRAKVPSLALPTRNRDGGFDIWHIDFKSK